MSGMETRALEAELGRQHQRRLAMDEATMLKELIDRHKVVMDEAKHDPSNGQFSAGGGSGTSGELKEHHDNLTQHGFAQTARNAEGQHYSKKVGSTVHNISVKPNGTWEHSSKHEKAVGPGQVVKRSFNAGGGALLSHLKTLQQPSSRGVV